MKVRVRHSQPAGIPKANRLFADVFQREHKLLPVADILSRDAKRRRRNGIGVEPGAQLVEFAKISLS